MELISNINTTSGITEGNKKCFCEDTAKIIYTVKIFSIKFAFIGII